jgi:hypothetical protein
VGVRQSKFWTNPWTITIIGGILVIIIVSLAHWVFGVFMPHGHSSAPPASASTAPPGHRASPVAGSASVKPVWSGPISISESGDGLDFDSVPPGNGSNTLLYDGSLLFTNGSIEIAPWTSSSVPTRDQCNTWTQTHPATQQTANAGTAYCLLTGQGHTVYLVVTSVSQAAGNSTVYGQATVWDTSGSNVQAAAHSPVYVKWWSGPIAISESGNGLDFDSNPPGNGANSLLYDGSLLFTNGTIEIAPWTMSSAPSGAQCSTWAQTHPSTEQTANAGTGYCLLTGQGHTVYLLVTSVSQSAGNGTVRAHATVWTP